MSYYKIFKYTKHKEEKDLVANKQINFEKNYYNYHIL